MDKNTYWNETLSLNIRSIDEEHKIFFEIVKDIEKTVKNGYKNFEIEFKKIFSHLVWHFKNEEDYMKSASLYKPYIDYHTSIHKNHVAQLGKMLDSVIKQNSIDNIVYHEELAINLVNFLKNWLVFHIIAEDFKIAQLIDLMNDGHSSEEAYKILNKNSNKELEILNKTFINLMKIYEFRDNKLLEIEKDVRISLENKERQLQEQIEENERKSITDELTGIYNRRYAMQILSHIWSKSKEPVCAIIQIDLDKFKEVNDTFGHHAGNIVLQKFTECIQKCLKTDEIANKYSLVNKELVNFCRLGGDEFIIILENFSLDDAVKIAINIHLAINALEVFNEASRLIWRGSVSIGVGCRSISNKDYESVLKEVDKYTYKAKGDGRNCVRSMLHEMGGGGIY